MSLNELLITLNMRGINQIKMRSNFDYVYKHNKYIPSECEVLNRLIYQTIEIPLWHRRFLGDQYYVIDISKVSTLEPISIIDNNDTITDSDFYASLTTPFASLFSLHYKDCILMDAYLDVLYNLENFLTV